MRAGGSSPTATTTAAFSGASLDRPALQNLLADVRAGKIDIVVVYKVDRLTRSLADFAKLVELFDQHAVSFVSVTQSFNTTSSMGRLTLNVLLSFAQFEREVIGERVRDKIAASKRKGIWVGGPGSARLSQRRQEARDRARGGRDRPHYLRALSGARLDGRFGRGARSARHPDQGQWPADGRMRGGIRFGVGPLAHLLKNRFYIGEVVYRGEVHRGEHEPILDRALFEAVQAKLAANAVARQVRLKGSPRLLTGRIFDDRGNRMSPTHANKRGVRYRYYVSQRSCRTARPKPAASPACRHPRSRRSCCDGVRQHLAASATEPPTTIADRELIERHVERVIVKPQALDVGLIPTSEASVQAESPSLDDPATARRDGHDHAALDGAKLRGHEGHPSCALHKASDEARKPRRSAHRHRQGPGMDRRHPARPRCLLRRDCRA